MSGIELRAKVFPLAFILYLFKPWVSIDGGQQFQVKWGVNQLTVPPGRHHVEVWFPYLFIPKANKAAAIVDVPAGGLVQVTYKSRWLVFLSGIIEVGGVATAGYGVQAPAAASGAQPAGWFPDPTHRYEQRYWDGTVWTEHVSRAGVQATDPVG